MFYNAVDNSEKESWCSGDIGTLIVMHNWVVGVKAIRIQALLRNGWL